jgi:hypothetical protein
LAYKSLQNALQRFKGIATPCKVLCIVVKSIADLCRVLCNVFLALQKSEKYFASFFGLCWNLQNALQRCKVFCNDLQGA